MFSLLVQKANVLSLTKGVGSASSSFLHMAPKKKVKPGILKNKASPCPKGKSKAKAKSKSKATGKHQRATLTKGKLAQLGKLTLDEKVKKTTEKANTAEEAAIVLKDSLTKDESAKLWSKHKTYLKGKEEEKEAHEQLGKKEKGLEVVLWFLKHKKGVFFHTETSKEASETLTKGEKWVSEHKMLQDFSKDEFEQHLASGRVKWRSDPWTPGIYQYCDQGDLTKQVQLKKKHKVTVGQEREMDDAEDEKEFMSYWGKGPLASMQEAEVAFKGQGPALTKGKGQGALTKGKGSRGSKGRGRGVLAIEDGDPNDTEDDKDKKTPEEQWAECLTKAQKSKEHLRVAVGNLEETLEAANQAGRTSKQDRKEAQLTLKHAQEWEQKLKAITNKKRVAMWKQQSKPSKMQWYAPTKSKQK